MRIPQKLSLFFITGASLLLLVVMVIFVVEQFTGYPQVIQDEKVDFESLQTEIDVLDNRVNFLKSEVGNGGHDGIER